MHTDNCCLQLGANIWPFIYSSQQGLSSALDLHEARAQGSSDLCWIKAQQRPECTLLFHFRREDRKWRQARLLFVSDGSQEMPESLKSSARKPTRKSLTQQSLNQCYQCLSYSNSARSSGQIIAAEQRSDREFLDSQWREVVVQWKTPPFNGLPEDIQRQGGGSCLCLYSQACLNYVQIYIYITILYSDMMMKSVAISHVKQWEIDTAVPYITVFHL